MPVKHRGAGLGGRPASLAGQHGEQLGKGLRRQDDFVVRDAGHNLGRGLLAIHAVDALSTGQDVGVERDPHGYRSYSSS
jgi:hypothetical protein